MVISSEWSVVYAIERYKRLHFPIFVRPLIHVFNNLKFFFWNLYSFDAQIE
jgi:hypothetical protein